MTPDLIEIVARTAFTRIGLGDGRVPGEWGAQTTTFQGLWRYYAQCILEAINESGTHRVVPVARPQRGGTLGLDDGAGRTMTIVQLGDENYEAEWPVAAYIIKIHHAAVAAVHALRSYEYGNSAPDLAAKVADDLEAALYPEEAASDEWAALGRAADEWPLACEMKGALRSGEASVVPVTLIETAELDALRAATLARMWINQPSTHQKFHHLHGVNVLAQREYGDTYRVYFISGDVINQQMPREALSVGWRVPKIIKKGED